LYNTAEVLQNYYTFTTVQRVLNGLPSALRFKIFWINKSADRDATNIHPLYDCKGITAMYLRFYVYAYLRKDGTPYYIGKGTGNRAWEKHQRKNGSELRPNDFSRIVILESNLSEIGAAAIERRLIRWHGKKIDGTGILLNQTDGGCDGGGVKGRKCSEEHKQKVSIAKKGKSSGNHLGRKRSAETCANISRGLTGIKKGPPSEETRRKISESLKKRKAAEAALLRP
jgi:hypothetical protein